MKHQYLYKKYSAHFIQITKWDYCRVSWRFCFRTCILESIAFFLCTQKGNFPWQVMMADSLWSKDQWEGSPYWGRHALWWLMNPILDLHILEQVGEEKVWSLLLVAWLDNSFRRLRSSLAVFSLESSNCWAARFVVDLNSTLSDDICLYIYISLTLQMIKFLVSRLLTATFPIFSY